MTKILLFAIIISILAGCRSDPKNSIESEEYTYETKALYTNLNKVAKNNILFGHQDDLAYGIGWKGGEFNSDIEKVSGDYPAVYGWDIGHIDSIMNLDSVAFDDMKAWMIKAYKKGGINTISWHEKNLLTKSSSWDTTTVVNQILQPGKIQDAYINQLNNVARFFNSVETESGTKVPVIFRPFHEHNGSWFWWGEGSCSDEDYIALWKFTVDYLRKSKGVNNILMCYSTDVFDRKEGYLSRYPGDDYVDILGFDDYHSIKKRETIGTLTKRLEIINSIAIEKNKVAVLSETGYETIPDEKWWTDVLLEGFKSAENTNHIAYLLIWRNARPEHHYAPYPGHISSENFKEFEKDTLTMFLSDLPDMYN